MQQPLVPRVRDVADSGNAVYLVALIPASAGLAGILITSKLSQANKRNEQADQAREELLADKNERIDMLKEQREELLAQVAGMEAKLAEIEQRPTRRSQRP